MTLELNATPEEVMRAVERLQQAGRERGLNEKEVFGMALALEECGSNVVDHCLKRNPKEKFRVIFEFSDDRVTIEIRDPGPRFDPTTIAQRTKAEEDAPPGGWGVQLVRRYVDEIGYRREAQENVLILIKKLNPGNRENGEAIL
jgi:serine/threonine-protein kinase RsbW